MSVSHNIFAFTAGEVSPQFYNRSDLTKYALGLSELTNFYVNFEGGISNRPGSALIGQIPGVGKPVRMMRFRATGDDFIVMLQEGKARYIRNGALLQSIGATSVLDVQRGPITRIVIDTQNVTEGRLVIFSGTTTLTELLGSFYEVRNPGPEGSGAGFDLYHIDGGGPVDSTNWPPYVGGASYRIVTEDDIPWALDEIEDVRMTQNKREAYLTHPNHPPQILRLLSGGTFTFSGLEAGSVNNPPTSVGTEASGTGSAGVSVTVTSVNASGEESIAARPVFALNIVNYSSTEGSLSVGWVPVPEAQYYNVYRSLLLPNSAEVTMAAEHGFIGRAVGSRFVDNNIIPDFTKSSPRRSNPFVNGAIFDVDVTAIGTGHTRDSVISVTDPTGTGFIGYPVVNQAGHLIDVVVVDPGANYTNPTFSITPGTGAIALGTVSPSAGNYPSVSARFQQRIVYGGSVNSPDTLWGTKPGTRYNFDFSLVAEPSDSYTFTLDSEDPAPIRHLVAIRQGLLIFTNYGIFQLRAAQGAGVTATNALTDPQGYKAVSVVEPLAIDLNVLFTQDEGSAMYAMNYTYYTESFQLQDITVLASHLFGSNNRVTRMEYMEEPDKLVHCLRSDGTKVVCTYEPDQEIVAWAREETRGYYRDILAIQENSRSTMYHIVDRYLNGAWRRFVERQYYRDAVQSEDAQFMDSALELSRFTPNETLTASATTGNNVAMTTSGNVTVQIGTIIYAGGGKFEVTSFSDFRNYIGNWLRPATPVPEGEGDIPVTYAEGAWESGIPVTTLTNLDHLEGEAVNVLGDGNVYENLTVTNGQVELPIGVTKAIVGLPFTSRATLLPPTAQRVVFEDKRKTIQGAAVNTINTRGLSMGAKGSTLYEIPNRTYEDWGNPIDSYDGARYSVITDGWQIGAQMQFEQRYPLPASILGVVSLIEIGDDA